MSTPKDETQDSSAEPVLKLKAMGREDTCADDTCADESDSIFTVPLKVARVSGTLNRLIEDLGASEGDEEPVPVPNTEAATLAKIIEYCEAHADDKPRKDHSDDENDENDEDLCWQDEDDEEPWCDCDKCERAETKSFDNTFMEGMLPRETIKLMETANFLDLQALIKLTSKRIALFVRSTRSVEEVQKVFDVEYDIPPEEEKKIEQENQALREGLEPIEPTDAEIEEQEQVRELLGLPQTA
jgi:S-phase kinase-associated protein 1